MKKSLIRSWCATAALSAVMSVSANAQAPAAAQPDYSKAEIKTVKISNNFYVLEGPGGTEGALVGSDGVFLVDASYAPMTEKIVAAIKQITDKPIRFMVNTHVHGDHTGGNENFGKMGVLIFSRDQLRQRLVRRPPAANGTPTPSAPAAALPVVTYQGRVQFSMNGEFVQLIPIMAAHTDGDTMVRFPEEDVIMTGDFYRSVGYPNIDRGNGGSLRGMLDGLGLLIGLAGPNTKIVPGHGPVVDRSAVIAHRDMLIVLRDRVAKLVKEGKTVQEVIAAHPTSDYDARVPMAADTTDRILGQLYAELK